MGGEADSWYQASVLQDRWGGANGGDPVTVPGLPTDEFDYSRIRPEVLHPGAAGKQEAIERAAEGGGKGGVGDTTNAVSPRDA